MGSRAGVNGVQETVLQEIQEDKEALLTIFMGNPKISVGLRKYGPLLEASCTRFHFFGGGGGGGGLLLWIHISHNIKLTCKLVLIVETTSLTRDIITFNFRSELVLDDQ